jgi:hypothetical protein
MVLESDADDAKKVVYASDIDRATMPTDSGTPLAELAGGGVFALPVTLAESSAAS